MAAIILALGYTEEGEIRNVYTGLDEAAAETKLKEAGEAGSIVDGFICRNPRPARHLSFDYVRERSDQGGNLG